jgi:hypothetical protein
MPFKGCGLDSETRHAFADFVIAREWGHLILEVDEDQHRHYDPSCDPRRDCDILASVALGCGDKVAIVRYNPDAYKIGGVTRPTRKQDRVAELLALINGPEPSSVRLFMYYDRDAPHAPLPSVAAEWDATARLLSRCIA